MSTNIDLLQNVYPSDSALSIYYPPSLYTAPPELRLRNFGGNTGTWQYGWGKTVGTIPPNPNPNWTQSTVKDWYGNSAKQNKIQYNITLKKYFIDDTYYSYKWIFTSNNGTDTFDSSINKTSTISNNFNDKDLQLYNGSGTSLSFNSNVSDNIVNPKITDLNFLRILLSVRSASGKTASVILENFVMNNQKMTILNNAQYTAESVNGVSNQTTLVLPISKIEDDINISFDLTLSKKSDLSTSTEANKLSLYFGLAVPITKPNKPISAYVTKNISDYTITYEPPKNNADMVGYIGNMYDEKNNIVESVEVKATSPITNILFTNFDKSASYNFTVQSKNLNGLSDEVVALPSPYKILLFDIILQSNNQYVVRFSKDDIESDPIKIIAIRNFDDNKVLLFTDIDNLNKIEINNMIYYDTSSLDLSIGAQYNIEGYSTEQILLSRYTFIFTEKLITIYPCFHNGTIIDTLFGPKTIETLTRNDYVKCIDDEYHKIISIYKFPLYCDYDVVVLKKNSCGENIPSDDLVVSDSHYVQINGVQNPSKNFINNSDIYGDSRSISYMYHLCVDYKSGDEMTYLYANNLLADCWTINHPYNVLYERYKLN